MPRLLVISPESADLSWLRNAPSLQACEIESVEGEADALRLLRGRGFDVVLTDPQHTS